MWKRFLNSKFFRLIRNRYLLVGIAFLVWITFFDGSSLIDWTRSLVNISNQESQKRYFKENIKRSEEKLQELSSNRDSLEKFAREQYRFKEDDEDVFILQNSKKR